MDSPFQDIENRPRKPMDSSPSSIVGVKRPAPASSLLPAFEYSSSPSLPRHAKRAAPDLPSKPTSRPPHMLAQLKEKRKYPTPVPTSSTGFVPTSSPPPLPSAGADPTRHAARPPLRRAVSGLTERAPLASVPTVELDRSGEPLLLGRSGKSAHYQLSANKLISRVHVRAAFVPAAPAVEVVCEGWNGLVAHCQGKRWELAKDDRFVSHSRDADVLLDVQDTRVLLRWPRPQAQQGATPDPESSVESEASPRRGGTDGGLHNGGVPGAPRSPLSSQLRRQRGRLQSPVSPTPIGRPNGPLSSASRRALISQQPPVIQIYEDEPSDDDAQAQPNATQPTQSTQHLTQPLGTLLDAQSADPQEFSDQDEENDPIITSFGPFGANLLPRMETFTTSATPGRTQNDAMENMAAPRAGLSLAPSPPREGTPSPYIRRPSPSHRRAQQEPPSPPPQAGPPDLGGDAAHRIVNHVVNQLAFSRVASTPLSTILGNLPTELRVVPGGGAGSGSDGHNENEDDAGADGPLATDPTQLSLAQLKSLLDATACVGEVPRAGKDAAGKTLESEYYYVPEEDFDDGRRAAVVEGLRKPGLRNCRKQHKVGDSS